MAMFEHEWPWVPREMALFSCDSSRIRRDSMHNTWTYASHLRVVASLGLAVIIAACDGETEPYSDDADTQSDVVEEAPSPDVITDVREIEWAPELDVNFDEMELQESGLYMQVLQTGSGPGAGHGDEMGVHYTVWLPNGSKLDSSYDHEPPDPLPMVLGVTTLIDGWIEGVTGMRAGERRKLVLPYDLAYGAGGRPGVPPYTPLTFIVELSEHIPAGEG